jgi:hypothetical protein
MCQIDNYTEDQEFFIIIIIQLQMGFHPVEVVLQ